jgi:myo-inositol 2-dehydrogenase/D-chiro-inositol 1-dehydrogenase
MSTLPLRVGILGYGRIGQLHAANVLASPGATLVGVADPLFAASPPALDGVPAYADPGHILEDPTIDAVLVCGPTPTHAEHIRRAAVAGKHVFCEKPVDLDPEVAQAALAVVEASGVKLQIGFNRRFDPSFRRVADAVHGGEIGELCMMRVISRDPSPPPLDYVRSSGGLFLDMMIHDFDMVRFVSGSEVVEVHARGAVRVDPRIGEAGDVDTAVVSLRLASGAIALIENSRLATYGYDQRVEAFGSAGAIEARNHTGAATLLKTAAGEQSEKPLAFFLERYEMAYRLELAEFLAAVREDRRPSVSAHDGLAPLWIALAAGRSLHSGRPEPVDGAAGSPRSGESTTGSPGSGKSTTVPV